MKVKLLRIDGEILIDAEIWDAKTRKISLPSITEGWRFNFKKHAKNQGFETYVLITEEKPNIIEGCLIFHMKGHVEPFMSYIEIAPHNQGKGREFERVAGCLIAFACRLSFMKGNDNYRGWLTFDVLEEEKENEVKLMTLYSKKYNALKYGKTTMVIPPEGSEKLINEFLN